MGMDTREKWSFFSPVCIPVNFFNSTGYTTIKVRRGQ
jgi:hypothetical protein